MNRRTITAILILRTPLHIGAGAHTDAVDDLVYRNAQGEVLIPGTSLAGALRTRATRLAPYLDGGRLCRALTDADSPQPCHCLTCQLFGTFNPQENVEDGMATQLWVYDAQLQQGKPLQVRDGVGIDRVTGAAARAERLKFDLEIVPSGAEFLLRLEINPRVAQVTEPERVLQLLAVVLAEWQAGRGVLGGRAGRGLGALTLKEVRYQDLALTSAQALFDYLRQYPNWSGKAGDEQWLQTAVAAAHITRKEQPALAATPEATALLAHSWVQVDFTFAIDGPFLVNDLVQATQSGFNHAPLLNLTNEGKLALLPGASLRGVLRSQAERIARTLATLAAWGDRAILASDAEAHYKAICPACNPLVSTPAEPGASCSSLIKQLPLEERRRLGKVGAENDLCLACRLFGSTWNGSRLRVEDATMVRAALVNGNDPKVLDFLAIDRFTGGGRDSAKFDAAVFWNPHFQIRLFLETPQQWEMGWLALTLRDLHDGLTTVGLGRSKGFGRGRITDLTLTVGCIQPDHSPLPTLSAPTATSGIYTTHTYQTTFVTSSTASEPVPTVDQHWITEVNRWVQAFHTELTATTQDKHPRSKRFPLLRDSYFDSTQPLTQLYPARVYPDKAVVS